MTAIRTLRRTRRAAYKYARIAGDINAIAGGPGPAARRFLVRKPLWKAFGKAMRKAGRRGADRGGAARDDGRLADDADAGAARFGHGDSCLDCVSGWK